MPPKPTDKKAPKKKGANGYKLPDPIPAGEVLTDIAKKQWIIGPSIGVGGFGEIYSASVHKPGKKLVYDHVVKIEPHGNGPLFVEMHFYMRNAKSSDIDAWIKKHGLPYLGMPRYIGSGSHEHKGQKYRFVVMERFGKDVWSLFLESQRIFPVATVFRIAHQVLDVLEYIHNRGYVHADIKGANILMDISDKLQYQTYLVDFGLASHYTTKDFKPDPKKAHNGTIEYTSRDAHQGVLTRRGDIEILAYNLLQWLGNTLPWEDNLKNPVNVQKKKEEFMHSISNITSKFKKLPVELKQLFEYVIGMQFDTEPDYEKLRDIFQNGYRNNVGSINDELLFITPPVTKTKKLIKRKTSPIREKYETSTPKEDATSPLRKVRTPSSATKKRTKEPSPKKRTKELEPEVPLNKITFDLAELSGSDDNYEPPQSMKVNPSKQSRNHLKRVPSDEKSPAKKVARNRRIKSSDDIDKSDEDLSKVTRSRSKRTQSIDVQNDISPSKLRKRVETPKKEAGKKLFKTIINSSDSENKNDTTEDIEKSDSDIFLSFTEETNVSLENLSIRRRSSGRFHPKNIQSLSPVKTSLSDDSPKKTSKRKVLSSTVDNNEAVKKTRSKNKSTIDWKNFPTIQNGRTVPK